MNNLGALSKKYEGSVALIHISRQGSSANYVEWYDKLVSLWIANAHQELLQEGVANPLRVAALSQCSKRWLVMTFQPGLSQQTQTNAKKHPTILSAATPALTPHSISQTVQRKATTTHEVILKFIRSTLKPWISQPEKTPSKIVMLYLESNQKCCNIVLPLRHGYIIQSSLLCLLPSGVWQRYISLDFVCVSVWTHVYARPVLLVQSDLFENVNEITVFQTSQAALCG